jgi:hypothetical protein
MLAEAEVFKGDRLVRRGPYRPKGEVREETISLRLDPDVLARLRESRPGWQSRINAVLREASGWRGGGRRARRTRQGRGATQHAGGAARSWLIAGPGMPQGGAFVAPDGGGAIAVGRVSAGCGAR